MEYLDKFITWLFSLSLTAVAGTIILALVTIRSILDVAKGMGFLPMKWYNWLYRSEELRFKSLLTDLGIMPRKKHFQAMTNFLDNPNLQHSISPKEIKNKFLIICKKHIDKQSLTVGDSKDLKVEYFLHLRRAFITGYDMELVKIMSSFVINTSKEKGITYDAIVSRKGALDLLGYLVAKRLNQPFVLFHDFENIMSETGAVYFDYLPPSVKNPLIVDDACASGDSILQMGNLLKTAMNINEVNAFVLFTRKADTKEKLQKNGILLHEIAHFEDSDLENLLK